MAFVATNKAPGVYIDEIDVPGPIPGVGTSTAAFIGPAQQGPINKPTFLTSFTQFQNAFGDYILTPLVYVTHAVRGFFDKHLCSHSDTLLDAEKSPYAEVTLERFHVAD